MKSVWMELKRNRASYVFLMPAAVYTLIFGYCTLPYMVIAFEDFNFVSGIRSPWVGLENFTFFFSSTRAFEVTRNTLLLNGLFILLGTVSAVVIALLLNEMRSRWLLKGSQSVMLFPHFLSWVIVGYILYAILNKEFGVMNRLLESFGMEPVGWYSEPKYWRFILTLLRVWKDAGYNSIIYLAAITGIDEGLYEAASIDGAGRMYQIRRITLPLLMPTVFVIALMSIGRMFYGDFAMFYALIRDNGSLMPVADVIDTYVFRMLRQTGDPAQAMAVGVYQSLMGFALVFGTNALTRKLYPDGALF